jgi:hypothetical protein
MAPAPARGQVILAECFHDPVQNLPAGVLTAGALGPRPHPRTPGGRSRGCHMNTWGHPPPPDAGATLVWVEIEQHEHHGRLWHAMSEYVSGTAHHHEASGDSHDGDGRVKLLPSQALRRRTSRAQSWAACRRREWPSHSFR